MSALGRHVEEYLALRRSFGFKLEREEQLLAQFVAYTETAGEEHLMSELAIAWAKLPVAASPNQWAKRLGVVRRFAVYLATIDPADRGTTARDLPDEPAPTGPLPVLRTRRRAGARKPREGLPRRFAQRPTRRCSGCLAASGMRIGEAIGLARGDVDLDSGVITIRHAKFDRTRLVPLHESTTAALSVYAATRDATLPTAACGRLLLLERRHGARTLRRRQDLPRDHDGARTSHRDDTSARARSPPRFCRPHARQLAAPGVSIDRHLATLSGYLGHVAPSDTYWYYSDSRVIPIPASRRA